MTHPYEDTPPESFWRSGVADADPALWPRIYHPKVKITSETAVATAGSCFAQHIGRALAQAGVNLLDAEPAPGAMSAALARRFGFGIYSARYGNIYTARQMRQLLEDAVAGRVEEGLFHRRNTRWFDALRPSVEPEGCLSCNEAMELRAEHLIRVLSLFQLTDVFIFTLGLTEGWIDTETGHVLPVAPGVLAGDYSETQYMFHNFSYDEVIQDLDEIRRILLSLNKNMKILLTVSPVPLTATASGGHVLGATQYSKAVLRAAAGDFATQHKNVDYFPSYDIVTATASAEEAFEDNLRSVRPEMVARVMRCFLAAQRLALPEMRDMAEPMMENTRLDRVGDEDIEGGDAEAVICEDALLEALRK